MLATSAVGVTAVPAAAGTSVGRKPGAQVSSSQLSPKNVRAENGAKDEGHLCRGSPADIFRELCPGGEGLKNLVTFTVFILSKDVSQFLVLALEGIQYYYKE